MHKTRDRSASAHRQTVQSAVQDIAGLLDEVLTRKLVAYMTGVTDSKTVARWADGKSKPRPEAEARLRAIYQVVQLLQAEESAHTVRAWFIGMNPQLEDVSPAAAMREGQVKDVLVAAKSYLAGG